ncbi:alpha-amylase family glycosyl hydrolase [Tenacibaculum sp. SG-28]|uniref:alpha-amylase family glycosyl hydrolase n=1 Tax=Tenacibaculum sp. SG-28 TaxID=754426 RepID=UPI0035129ED3
MKKIGLSIVFLVLVSCTTKSSNTSKLQENKQEVPFTWNAANVYFLLTDRFSNGDPKNDMAFSRVEKTGKLRGFEGGDLRGVIDKIENGYFTKLGVNVLWMTPIVEQIHGAVDEGTGVTYGYHGYWTKDWTKIDPNFGTKEILHELVKVAHANGIKVMLDAVLNHTGPVTEQDPLWPEEWVRTIPQCTYDTYSNTVTCTLVKNLPDVKTESNQEVQLPEHLVEKWKTEGRYQEEVQELDAFFKETGYPRAPRFYIMKWLADYIEEFGIDGYRVDTVKHVEETVWQEFYTICQKAFATYKKIILKNYMKKIFT